MSGRFTSHGEVCYEATSPGLWDHPYWGPFEQWWPAEPVPRAQLSACNSRGAVMEGGQVATLEEVYQAFRKSPSDFNEHMDTLRKLAKDQVCVELSSWLKPALLSMAAGEPKELVSVCRGGKPEWGILKNFLGDRFHFIQQDPLSTDPIGCDLLFIDTRHSAGELQALLERWAPLCTGRVVVHCTETYGDRGDDGSLGVNHALIGLVKADQGWKVAGHWRNNHGLTVLSRTEEVLHDPTIDSPNALPVGKGPGTELKKLLSGLGINPTPSCDCNAYAAQMDAWGVPGCKEKREEIINWLRANQGRWGWKDRLMAAARAVASGLAFQLNPLDPFPGLVDAAIEAAEKEEK